MKNQRKLLELEGKDLQEAVDRLIAENKPYPRWTVKEEEIVRKLYGKIPTRLLAEKLGKTYASINMKAIRLGISKPYKRSDNRNS